MNLRSFWLNLNVTPLHAASSKGHLEIVKYLITECDCNPNSFDNFGLTPLCYALTGEHLEVIQYLIRECKCSSVCSLQHCDILEQQCGEWDLLDIWKKISDLNITPLQMAALQGDLETVKALYNYNPHAESLGVTAQETFMAFHATCSSGKVDIMNYLIKYLVPKSFEILSGLLYISCVHGHLDTVKFLIVTHIVQMMMALLHCMAHAQIQSI